MNIKLRPTDILFSKYLRKKRGFKSDFSSIFYSEGIGLSVSHFKGRRRENTRFDEDNCDILNFTEHRHFEENPDEYTEWKKKKLGEKRYKELLIRAETYKKRDDKMDLLIIKELLKFLE